MSVAEAQDWLKPWVQVSGGVAAALERELRAELSAAHVLFGRPVRAIACRSDSDDVLFVAEAPREFAVVHLAYASHPEQTAQWPFTRLFSSRRAFTDECMVPDHSQFTSTS